MGANLGIARFRPRCLRCSKQIPADCSQTCDGGSHQSSKQRTDRGGRNITDKAQQAFQDIRNLDVGKEAGPQFVNDQNPRHKARTNDGHQD